MWGGIGNIRGIGGAALIRWLAMHHSSLRLLALSALVIATTAAGEAPRPAARPETEGGYGALLAGQHAAAENDPEFAADRFLAALAVLPGSPPLRLQAFLASALAGRPEAQRLARDMPDAAVARLLLANADALAGRWSLAADRLRAPGWVGPTSVLQPLLLAWTEQAQGHPTAALARLRAAGAEARPDPRASGVAAFHAALIADLAGKRAEAEEFYGLAAQGSGNVMLRLGQALASWETRRGPSGGGPSAEAGTAAARLEARVAPGDPLHAALPDLLAQAQTPIVRNAREGFAEAYLALAVALHRQEAEGLAELMLRYALDLRPDFAAARLLLSDLQEVQRRPHAALETLAPIGPTDPLANVVRLRRDAFQAETGHAEQAEADLRAMTAQFPHRIEPPLQLGELLRNAGRHAEAAAAFGVAIARLPPNDIASWRLYYGRGVAYERARDWARAEPDLLRAAELAPNNPLVLNYLAYAWADMGQHLRQARQMLERAAAARPDDGAIIDSLGWVKLRQGDVAGAVEALEHAVELATEDAVVNAHLGDAYWAAGRRLEAEYQWRRALNLHPDPDVVARIRTRLDQAEARPARDAASAQAQLPQPN